MDITKLRFVVSNVYQNDEEIIIKKGDCTITSLKDLTPKISNLRKYLDTNGLFVVKKIMFKYDKINVVYYQNHRFDLDNACTYYLNDKKITGYNEVNCVFNLSGIPIEYHNFIKKISNLHKF